MVNITSRIYVKKNCYQFVVHAFALFCVKFFTVQSQFLGFLGQTALLGCNARLVYPMGCGSRCPELGECAPTWGCSLAAI